MSSRDELPIERIAAVRERGVAVAARLPRRRACLVNQMCRAALSGIELRPEIIRLARFHGEEEEGATEDEERRRQTSRGPE